VSTTSGGPAYGLSPESAFDYDHGAAGRTAIEPDREPGAADGKRARKVRAGNPMKLSIVIPVYNERGTIEEVLRRIEEVAIPGVEKEVVLVDDGSTDGTREIIEGYRDRHTVVLHRGNFGKGAALRSGFARAAGDVILVQDADLEYFPEDYPALVAPIRDGEARVVYGSRRLRRENRQHSGFLFFLGGIYLTILTNLLYRTRITDEPTCYKVFEGSLLREIPLVCRRFEFCPEITAKVARRGIRIHEIPIRYAPRSVREGKKIGWRDAIEATWTLLKYRLVLDRRPAPLPPLVSPDPAE
jgi:glycosyltransferase involved in cell wall biosynthesis